MSVFGFERIYLRLKSRNNSAVYRNLVEGVENGAFHLIINREPILMRNLDHTMNGYRTETGLNDKSNYSLSILKGSHGITTWSN